MGKVKRYHLREKTEERPEIYKLMVYYYQSAFSTESDHEIKQYMARQFVSAMLKGDYIVFSKIGANTDAPSTYFWRAEVQLVKPKKEVKEQ